MKRIWQLAFFSIFVQKKTFVDQIFYLATTVDGWMATNQWPFLSLFYALLLSLFCVCNIDLVKEEGVDQRGFFEYTSDPVIAALSTVESESEIQAAAVSLSLSLSSTHTHIHTNARAHTHTHAHTVTSVFSHTQGRHILVCVRVSQLYASSIVLEKNELLKIFRFHFSFSLSVT